MRDLRNIVPYTSSRWRLRDPLRRNRNRWKNTCLRCRKNKIVAVQVRIHCNENRIDGSHTSGNGLRSLRNRLLHRSGRCLLHSFYMRYLRPGTGAAIARCLVVIGTKAMVHSTRYTCVLRRVDTTMCIDLGLVFREGEAVHLLIQHPSDGVRHCLDQMNGSRYSLRPWCRHRRRCRCGSSIRLIRIGRRRDGRGARLHGRPRP